MIQRLAEEERHSHAEQYVYLHYHIQHYLQPLLSDTNLETRFFFFLFSPLA